MKTSKKALFTSVLSLLLCCSMLVGTTFAWFTDEVTSGINTITAGNLDVNLYHSNKNTPEEPVTPATALFGDVTLWEPGVVAYENLKVTNEGDLKLKYLLSVNVEAAGGKTLADVLQVAVVDPVVTDDRDVLLGGIAADAWQSLTTFAADGKLEPGGSEAYGIVIYWEPSNADNDYMGKTVKLGVKLQATQLTGEFDSFDEKYDKDAPLPWNGKTEAVSEAAGVYEIRNAENLAWIAEQVNGGSTFAGKTVKLMVDVDLNNLPWTSIGQAYNGSIFCGTFDGNGHTISNLYVSGGEKVGFFNCTSGAVIENVTFRNATVTGNHWAGVVVGFEGSNSQLTTIRNVVVDGAKVTAAAERMDNGSYDNGDKVGGIVGYATSVKIENCEVKNSTITGYRDVGGIIGCAQPVGVGVTVTGNKATNVTIKVDPTHNYQNYTKPEQYNAGEIVGRVIGMPTMENNVSTLCNVIVPQEIVTVGTVADLKNMLTTYTASGSGDNVINITSDIRFNAGDTWEPVYVEGYTGAGVITINGNGHTIYGLPNTLISGGFAGNSGVVIKDLTIANANITHNTGKDEQAVGAFIGMIDAMPTIELNNCKLIDSEISSGDHGWVGGLIGYTAGYNGEGAVMTNITIMDCVIDNVKITATKGSAGAVIGHAGGNPYTKHNISGITVKNCTITGEKTAKTGVILGTAGVGEVTLAYGASNIFGNKTMLGGTEAALDVIIGRFAPAGGNGALTINGVAYAQSYTECIK